MSYYHMAKLMDNKFLQPLVAKFPSENQLLLLGLINGKTTGRRCGSQALKQGLNQAIFLSHAKNDKANFPFENNELLSHG